MKKFKYPFRVGRKQGRAVLDADGLEVVIFNPGLSEIAGLTCRLYNQHYANPPKDKALHRKAYGAVGASSETMFNYFMGNDVPWPDHPYDSGDFARCYGLLEAVPEWKERIDELSSLSPEWKSLVSEWQLLVVMHENNHSMISDKIRSLIKL